MIIYSHGEGRGAQAVRATAAEAVGPGAARAERAGPPTEGPGGRGGRQGSGGDINWVGI